MRIQSIGGFMLSILGMSTLALSGISGAAASPVPSRPGQYYLSLGDSLAFGYQQYKADAETNATGTLDPATFTTGYTDDLTRMLRAVQPTIQTVNYGCPGETTETFLQGPACPFPLHDAHAGSQMDAAIAFLKAHPGQVSPITVSIANNDVVQLVDKCGGLTNLACVVAGLPAVLQRIAVNLGAILGSLRTYAPDSQIVVFNVYNPFAAVSTATNALAEAENGKIIAPVAAATGVQVADVYTPFNLAQPQPQTVCRLTLFCTPLHDDHATDAGYLVMAQQAWNATGFNRAGDGFMVSFSSPTAGQGEVYFGSGPGCSGLVEVATQDLHPGSTEHSVLVQGNDLPGTVGDNGIVPGTTYYYETVTMTSSGPQIDDNGGACYSTTIPAS